MAMIHVYQRGFDYVMRDQFGYNYALKDKFIYDQRQRQISKSNCWCRQMTIIHSHMVSSGHAIRDAYICHLSQLADLRLDERSTTSSIVYLDGVYWGVYEMREKLMIMILLIIIMIKIKIIFSI